MINSKISHQYINPQAINICRTLNDAGYQAYLVGGCVRDLLLGLKPKDYDLTTNATPEQIESIFTKTYPSGLQHGTITVLMGEGIENHFEVTTFREESEYKDGRRPEKVFFVMDIKQDLGRRDLTINAMAYDPLNNQLLDPFDGIHDLQHKIIRAVGFPEARFQEDGLRILRAARFTARFDYAMDESTFQGMMDSLETLKKISKERIKDELCKILKTNNPSRGLKILWDIGAFDFISPLLASNLDNYHLLTFQNKCYGNLETKLALLYYLHPIDQINNDLIQLKFSNQEIKRIIFLLSINMTYRDFQQTPSISLYRRFIAQIKNLAPDPWETTLEQFISLQEALQEDPRHLLKPFRNEIVISRKEMQLNGNDLIKLGVSPGPQIKNILDKCYLEILQHPEYNNKNYLLQFAVQ